MSSSASKRILRKQLEMVHAVIREGDLAEEEGKQQRKRRKHLGIASGPKRRKLTTREQLVRAQELEDKKKDMTLLNMRALVPADAYAKMAPKLREQQQKEQKSRKRARDYHDEDDDDLDDDAYIAQASSAAAESAAAELESTYEDATLGEYMKSIKRLRGETKEQIRRKRARIAEAELAASVDAISREDVPLDLIQRAAAQLPLDFDGSDEEMMMEKKKKKASSAKKLKKKKASQKTQDKATKREMEEARLAMSVPTIARAANKLRNKKH